jgi:hypothetical protein
MIKLPKKELRKVYSFGIEGINDEWEQVGQWDGFRKYKNRENEFVTTFSESYMAPSSLGQLFESEMFSILGKKDEYLVVGSKNVFKAIQKMKDTK